MGEVYRADDLRLEQPVALKFLPHGLDGDGERLARFYREVRIARQVSHPAVCRVYDVAEADVPLLPLDGARRRREPRLAAAAHRAAADRQGARDRAPALRRARRRAREGRAAPRPQARQRDARRPGQRAHHRLRPRRPRRVALGRRRALGHAVLHVAGAAAGARGHGPQRHLLRSACVLYELFTGRRAFEGKSLAEYTRKHRDERPIEPSALVAGARPRRRAGDPGLPREGAAPPAVVSPHVVSAMLTGSDPLEAALAAGETPSPELVAAAGEREGLRPAVRLGPARASRSPASRCVPLVGSTFRLLETVPARQAAGGARGPRAGVHAHAWRLATAPVDDALGPRRATGATPATSREKDPRPAAGSEPRRAARRRCFSSGTGRARGRSCRCSRAARSTAGKPALEVSGMAGGPATTCEGRLLRFYADPAAARGRAHGTGRGARLVARSSPRRASTRPRSVRWRRAGRRSSTSTRARRGRARGRAGPTSPSGSRPRRTAGAPRGSRSSGRGRSPSAWRPQCVADRQARCSQALFLTLVFLLLGAAGFMARRNMVLGRGDRRGAFRVSLLLSRRVGIVSWALGAHNVADWNAQIGLVSRGAGLVVLEATLRLARVPRRRALRPPPAPVDARVLDAVPRRRLLRPGGGPRHPRRRRVGDPGLLPEHAALRGAAASRPAGARAVVQLSRRAARPGTTAFGGAQCRERVHHHARSASLLLFVLLRMLLRRDALAIAALAVVLLCRTASAWASRSGSGCRSPSR